LHRWRQDLRREPCDPQGRLRRAEPPRYGRQPAHARFDGRSAAVLHPLVPGRRDPAAIRALLQQHRVPFQRTAEALIKPNQPSSKEAMTDSNRHVLVRPVHFATLIGAIAAFSLLAFSGSRASAAQNFDPNRTDDPSPIMCGGSCSLREAVIAANGTPGPDTIQLQGGQTYT